MSVADATQPGTPTLRLSPVPDFLNDDDDHDDDDREDATRRLSCGSSVVVVSDVDDTPATVATNSDVMANDKGFQFGIQDSRDAL